MGYTVILPTLNESGHIVSLIKDIGSVLSELKQKYEIIIVDDGCPQNSGKLAAKIAKKFANIKIFFHKKI